MTAAARSDDESGTAHLGRVHQDASERWSVTAEVMAQALGGRRAGSAWMARCPAHDDHVPSLAIDERSDGTVLVCGHAGCSQHAVINALTARGLWPGVSGRSLAQVPVPPRQRTDREPPPSRTRIGAAMSIWHRSEPAAGTLVETYLRTRGITRPPPKVLNHHASNAVKNGEDVAVHPTTAVQPPAACRDVPANGGDPHRLRPAGGAHMHAHDHDFHRARSSGAALRPHGPRRPHRRRCRRCQGHVATRHGRRERVMRTPPFLVRPVSTHPKDAGSAKDRTHGTPRTRRTTPSLHSAAGWRGRL